MSLEVTMESPAVSNSTSRGKPISRSALPANRKSSPERTVNGRTARINCFNCLQTSEEGRRPKVPDPPAKVPDLAARKKGRTAPQR